MPNQTAVLGLELRIYPLHPSWLKTACALMKRVAFDSCVCVTVDRH